MNSATEEFHRIARSAVDQLLAHDPVEATWLGDHRFDGELPDMSDARMTEFATTLEDFLTELDAVDDVELVTSDLVDLEILRAQLLKAHFYITQVQQYKWNPMVWNPGTALHLLLSRDFAPEEERMENVRSRALRIPDFLATARRTLTVMSAIHVETAIGQLQGTLTLVGSLHLPDEVARSITEHIDWLKEQIPFATRSPRMGSELYSGILWHSLDEESDVRVLREVANTHLDDITEKLGEVAAKYVQLANIDPGSNPVRTVLDHIAASAPVTNHSVLQLVEKAVASSRDFTVAHSLVTVPDIASEVIEMPEIHRGVAVAYCDAPGPMETARIPTFVAVSPTPSDWSNQRQESFYREYNAVQIHDLTIHEAFPGHVLQLAHSSGEEVSLVRKFGMSGAFIEGWAVYAEELMINAGYSPEPTELSRLAIRMQQLKMQARMTINALLDVGVHTDEMTEGEAMELMQVRGFQEEGEATGKWRRALLTAGQLPTYFVGYRAVKELAQDLEVMHPDWDKRQIHDLMLSFGSPAPRYVRELVGL